MNLVRKSLVDAIRKFQLVKRCGDGTLYSTPSAKNAEAEFAELLLACAVAQVSAQIFCPQCSRLHCLAQGAQLNSLKTLLAADLRCSLPTVNGL